MLYHRLYLGRLVILKDKDIFLSHIQVNMILILTTLRFGLLGCRTAIRVSVSTGVAWSSISIGCFVDGVWWIRSISAICRQRVRNPYSEV